MRAIGVSIIQISQLLKYAPANVTKLILKSTVNQYTTRSYRVAAQYYGSTQTSEKISEVHNGAKVFSENEMIHIITEGGNCNKYPWVWLRDNCQCKSCFNPQMQSRTIDWRDFDVSVHPKSFSKSNDMVNISWSDGHESQYSFKWLQEREFNHYAQEQWLKNVYRLKKIAWNSENFPQTLRRFKYDNIIKSDEQLLHWLESLAVFGIAIIEDTPSREDQLQKLANRIGFIRKTHYGEEFVVRNKPDTTTLAYLAIPLQMHTDMPYYDYKPGVNMLHCIEQAKEGGDNQFTDALYLSQLLKKTHPDIYKILSNTSVEWSDVGEEKGDKFYSIYRAPIICENQFGEFERVNYNQWQRDSHFTVPLETVKAWYKAYDIFTQALYDPKNMVEFKTKPGDILTFDNIRLVHGRSGYTDSANNERHIIGSYLDWDIIHSRIRVLKRETTSNNN